MKEEKLTINVGKCRYEIYPGGPKGYILEVVEDKKSLCELWYEDLEKVINKMAIIIAIHNWNNGYYEGYAEGKKVTDTDGGLG